MPGTLREADRRTRSFFGGPGIGFFALFAVVVLVGTGTVQIIGIPPHVVALAFAAVALGIIGVGRVRRRS